jgi:hypothetical protein
VRAVKKVILAVLAAAVLILALRLWFSVREVERLAQVNAADSARLSAIREESARAGRLPAQVAQAPRGKDSAVPQPNPPPVQKWNVVHVSTLKTDNPELWKALWDTHRNSMLFQYGAFLAKMDLSPDKLAALKDLLTERGIAHLEASWASSVNGRPPASLNDEDTSPIVANVDRRIEDLLGAQAYGELEKKTDENTVIARYASNIAFEAAYLDDDGVPLSRDQADALTLVYAGVVDPKLNPAAADRASLVVDPRTYLTPLDQEYLKRAASVVGPGQLESLAKAYADHNRAMVVGREYGPAQQFREAPARR